MTEENQSAPRNQLNYFSVDIETLGLDEDAVILSIGAVGFGITGLYEEFYVEIDPDQSKRTVTPSIVKWWMQQPIPAPINGFISLKGALIMFRDYLHDHTREPIIWCKGIDFDTKILAHAYKQEFLTVPWKYNHVRDTRTLMKVFPSLKPERANNLVAHNALGDAKYQALCVKEILQGTGGEWL